MKSSWPCSGKWKKIFFFTEIIAILKHAKGRRYVTETIGGAIKGKECAANSDEGMVIQQRNGT